MRETRIRQGVLAYLDAVSKLPETVASRHVFGRNQIELFVDVYVRCLRTSSLSLTQMSRWGKPPPEEDEDLLRSHGLPSEEAPEAEWLTEYNQFDRAVLIGAPGAGKSLLAQMTARKIAINSRRILESSQDAVESICLPFVIDLADIARMGFFTALDSTIRATLSATEVDPLLSAFFHRSVLTKHAYLLLDAMDEVQTLNDLKSALSLLRNSACRILVTSRKYGYVPELLPFRPSCHYELIPFVTSQMRDFVSRWFREDERGRNRVYTLIASRPQFYQLSRNPLLLNLMCAAIEHTPLLEITRRSDLYRYVLRLIVRGEGRRDNDPHVSIVIRVLRRIAWRLFSSNTVMTAFTEDQWLDEIGVAIAEERDSFSASALLGELQEKGLIFAPALGYLAFLHRSFLDFLTAEELARRPVQDTLAKLDQFFWQTRSDGKVRWEPATAEMITHLAGCMEDPNPLIKKLLDVDHTPQRLFRPMLLLASRALADCDPKVVPSETGNLIIEEVLGSIGAEVPTDEGCSMREDVISSLPLPGLVRALIAHQNEALRSDAARMLGYFADRVVADALIAALRSDHSGMVRFEAASSLIKQARPETVGALATALTDPDSSIRAAALSGILLEERLAGLIAWRWKPNSDELEAAKAQGSLAIHAQPPYDREFTIQLARAFFPIESSSADPLSGIEAPRGTRLLFFLDGGTEDGAGVIVVKRLTREDVFLFYDHLKTYWRSLSFASLFESVFEAKNAFDREMQLDARSAGDTSPTEMLLGLLKESDIRVRRMAATRLLAFRDERVSELLIQILTTLSCPEAEDWALASLKLGADCGRVQLLLDSGGIDASEPLVNNEASRDSSELVSALQPDDELTLIRALRDPLGSVADRRRAANRLGEKGALTALDGLLEIAFNRANDVGLRSDAMEAALSIDAESAEGLLIAVTCSEDEDFEFRRKAARHLRDLGSQNALDPLAIQVKKHLTGDHPVPWQLIDAYYVIERDTGALGFVRTPER